LSQHPTDVLIRNVSESALQATPQDVHDIIHRVGAASFRQ
jgi:hypothetical protein